MEKIVVRIRRNANDDECLNLENRFGKFYERIASENQYDTDDSFSKSNRENEFPEFHLENSSNITDNIRRNNDEERPNSNREESISLNPILTLLYIFFMILSEHFFESHFS